MNHKFMTEEEKILKRKQLSASIAKYLLFTYLLISVIGLLHGLDLYWKGFHNMDLGQNLRWINAEYDLNLGDTANNYKTYSPEFIYILGTSQMKLSLFYLITSSVLFGIALGFLMLTYSLKNDRKNSMVE